MLIPYETGCELHEHSKLRNAYYTKQVVSNVLYVCLDWVVPDYIGLTEVGLDQVKSVHKSLVHHTDFVESL